MEQQVSSRYSLVQVPLSEYAASAVPPAQLAIGSDDGKELSVVVRGGKGLSDKVAATLEVTHQSGKTFLIQPTSLTVTEGRVVAMTFPSPTSLKVKPTAAPLTLSFEDNRKAHSSRAYVLALGAEARASPGNPVHGMSSSIISDASGVGRLSMIVGAAPGVKALKLLVTGADVREDAAIGAPPYSSKGVTVKPDSVAILRLGNLSPGVPVVITTTLDGQAAGNPLRFSVERTAVSK